MNSFGNEILMYEVFKKNNFDDLENIITLKSKFIYENSKIVKGKVLEDKQEMILENIEMPLIYVLANMEINGFKYEDDKLKEMKEDKKYESFFGKTSSAGSNHGTGSNAGHSGNNEDDKNDLGKRLAEQRKNSMSAIKKSNYFND